MSRATDDAFDALHGLFAESLTDELKRAFMASRQPKTILDADGKTIRNPAYEPLSPQFLNQVRAFLKDNGIDSPGRSKRVSDLANALQDLDLDEAAQDRHFN